MCDVIKKFLRFLKSMTSRSFLDKLDTSGALALWEALWIPIGILTFTKILCYYTLHTIPPPSVPNDSKPKFRQCALNFLLKSI